ncbi:MAG: hypothetical protein AAB289_05610, partial [Chloroflexota bacterium]
HADVIAIVIKFLGHGPAPSSLFVVEGYSCWRFSALILLMIGALNQPVFNRLSQFLPRLSYRCKTSAQQACGGTGRCEDRGLHAPG